MTLLPLSFAACPGFGADGQLGQESNSSLGMGSGTMGDSLRPLDLGENRTAVAVSGGAVHTCAGKREYDECDWIITVGDWS